MNTTTANVQKVSFIFFSILGLSHIIAGLMIVNDYLRPISFIIHRSLDIPFIITALLYGFSSLAINNRKQSFNYLYIGLGIIIFLAVVYINFFIPDRPLQDFLT